METKQAKLAALGSEVLAKALLNLAERSDQAAELIERLLASSDEKILHLRALLDSILQRAQSKYYHHGVRYLRKLDHLALKIQDWQNLGSHEAYKAAVAEQHARKRSFWGQYGQRP